MPIEVRPILPVDLDLLERGCAIEPLAFAKNTTPVSSLIFCGPFPETEAKDKATDMAKAMREEGFRLFGAFDTDVEGPEALLGWAKWFVYEDAMPKPKPRVFSPGINPEPAAVMFGAIDGVRERNMTGKPCVYLNVLVVHPDHQGRGIGKQLMSWGMQEAVRLNIPAWLEASPAGKFLYEKCGFKVIDTIVEPFDRFGVDSSFTVWGMQWDVPNNRCP